MKATCQSKDSSDELFPVLILGGLGLFPPKMTVAA